MIRMQYVGKGFDDMILTVVLLRPRHERSLTSESTGDPNWFVIEAGCADPLTCVKIHDVMVRGLEMRDNRNPSECGTAVSVDGSERMVMEDCRIEWADFTGLFMGCAIIAWSAAAISPTTDARASTWA